MRRVLKQLIFMSVLLLTLTSMMFSTLAQVSADDLQMYFSRLEALGLSGTFLIEQNGETLVHEGYGLANERTGDENTTDTIFQIGSITKTFTATAIGQLIMAGQIDVDAPISEYLSDVPADKSEITVRQLLTHTAGLETYHDTQGTYEPMTREQAQQRIFNTPLFAPPGTEENYSNSGYTVLALLIEVISGQTYEAYIRENILIPLEMTRSGFVGEAFDEMAFSPNDRLGFGSPADWRTTWAIKGSGGIVASVADLRTFINALRGDELLSTEAKEATRLNVAEQGLFSAGGDDTTRYNASMAYIPSLDLLMVGLTNTWDFQAEFVLFDLFTMIRDDDFRLPPQVMPQDEASLQQFIGDYQLESGGLIRVAVEDGTLAVSAFSQDAINLLIGVDEDMADLFTQFNDLTAQIGDAIREDTVADLVAQYNTSNPFLAQVVADFMRQIVRDEAVAMTTVMGSMPSIFPDETDSTLQVDFAERTEYLRLFWANNGELVGARFLNAEEFNAPLSVTYFPTSESTFASFDLMQERPPITIVGDTLTVMLGEAQFNATRVG